MSRFRLRMKRADTLWDIALIAPQFIIYFTLTILPFIISLPIIFSDQVDLLDTNAQFIGMQNFKDVFKYPLVDEFIPALKRTATFTLLNYLMVFLFGIPLALFMFEFESKFKKVKNTFFTVIFLPWMLSGVGTAILVLLLFSRDTGNYNLLLLKLGMISEAFDVKTPIATTAILPLIVGWRAAGFNMALFLGGLLSIPIETIEASIIDGANYFKRLLHVYFPQMIPNFIIATIFCMIGSFGLFDECVGLGGFAGNAAARFISIILYEMGFGGIGGRLGTMAQGITMALTVFVPLMVLAFFLNRLQKRLEY